MVGKVPDPAQAAQGGDTASADFFGLVSKLLGELSSGSETDEVWAGQQVSRTKKDQAAEGEPVADVQLECLLRSMGVIQGLPSAVPGFTEAPNAMLSSGVTDPGPSAAPNAPTLEGALDVCAPRISEQVFNLPVQVQASQAEPVATQVATESEAPRVAATTEMPSQEVITTPDNQAADNAEVSPAPSQAEVGVTQAAVVKEQGTVQQADATGKQPVREAMAAESSGKHEEAAAEQSVETVASAAGPVDAPSDKSKPVRAQREGAFSARPVDGRVAVAVTPEAQASVVRPTGSASGDGADLLFSHDTQPARTAQKPDQTNSEPVADAVKGIEIPPQQVSEFRAVDAAASTEAQLPPERVIGTKMIHQIVRAAKVNLFPGGGDMTLRLDPPHLGAVQMNVTVAEGTVTASIQASTESARQILDSNLPNLRQALAEAGMNVDSINVSVNANPNHDWNYQAGTFGGSSHNNSHGGAHRGASVGIETGNEAAGVEARMSAGALNFLA